MPSERGPVAHPRDTEVLKLGHARRVLARQHAERRLDLPRQRANGHRITGPKNEDAIGAGGGVLVAATDHLVHTVALLADRAEDVDARVQEELAPQIALR